MFRQGLELSCTVHWGVGNMFLLSMKTDMLGGRIWSSDYKIPCTRRTKQLHLYFKCFKSILPFIFCDPHQETLITENLRSRLQVMNNVRISWGKTNREILLTKTISICLYWRTNHCNSILYNIAFKILCKLFSFPWNVKQASSPSNSHGKCTGSFCSQTMFELIWK